MDNASIDISWLQRFPGTKWSTMSIHSQHPQKQNPQILSRFAIHESLVPQKMKRITQTFTNQFFVDCSQLRMKLQILSHENLNPIVLYTC